MTVEKYDDDNWYELGYLFAGHVCTDYLPKTNDPSAQTEWLAGFFQRYNSSSNSTRQLIHSTLKQLISSQARPTALLRTLSRRLKLTPPLTTPLRQGRQVEAMYS